MLELMVKNRDSNGPWTDDDYYFKDLDTWANFLRSQEGDFYNDVSLSTVVTRRAWRNKMVDWLIAAPIARVVMTNAGKIRVTRTDGAKMETGQEFE
jgi:hypothetical protein